MGISLSDFEHGTPFSGDYGAALLALQERLAALHLAQVVHGGRTIILFEGWQGGGKKAALKALAGALDPCHSAVHCVGKVDADAGPHWLSPYWSRLPSAGEARIFFRSWYSDAAYRRAGGDLADKSWARTCDEINEFEAQQTDHGTSIVKLFFHVTAEVQERRLAERRQNPWLRALAGSQQSLPGRDQQLAAWTDLFKRTDTRWAHWTVVDAGDERAGRIAALSAIITALEKLVPAEPPQRPDNVVDLNQERFG